MKNSKIEWTHHTFNPWRGCTKVSPGCANCYAEKLSKRNPAQLGVWGDKGTRIVAAESYWKQPHRWNRDAFVAGERHRVFCASLADVFEDRPELVAPRGRLIQLIDQTPHLDWLLLTKRPENVMRLIKEAMEAIGPDVMTSPSGILNYLPHLRIGTSIENQEAADKRLPELIKIPAAGYFLSCEPLLGNVDLRLTVKFCGGSEVPKDITRKMWVIAGGESGGGARPMNPEWPRSLRDQCQAAGLPFHFKQWGEWAPDDFSYVTESGKTPPRCWIYQDGRTLSSRGNGATVQMMRVGKEKAGRMLDGREWTEFPTATEATI